VKTSIRVGNAQAFWGDRASAAIDLLVQAPDLDFLTMDYLAEVSMSILASQRERDPSKGFAQDFVEVVRRLADYWASGGRCRLIANAGGLCPEACAAACKKALEEAGGRTMRIGVVSGDNAFTLLSSGTGTEPEYRNLDDGRLLADVQSRLVTANAYMGCEGIVKALDAGADLVITGRVADPSMVVGACVHAFGWSRQDWNRLAGATVAGHLLECGTQVTGGIATDWWNVSDPVHLGFPIAEIDAEGSCVITKAESAGGCVTEETVKEQLLYEIGDPANYLSPDVAVSFLNLKVERLGKDRIQVLDAVGSPPPKTLKVSATYRDGYRAAGSLTVFGQDAVRKARRCGEIVMTRLEEAGWRYRDAIIECLGNGDSVPVLEPLATCNPYETVLRMAVESEAKEAVEAFAREMIPLVTAGPQGTTGYAEGRPKLHAVVRYWPCLIDADKMPVSIQCLATEDATARRQRPAVWPPERPSPPQDRPVSNIRMGVGSQPEEQSAPQRDANRLLEIAFGRSGDKGTGANIGILARSPSDYPRLLQGLTAERVHAYFAPLGVESVQRYELPNLNGLNFVVRGILRRSLRNDAQGKALAQALLAMPLKALDNPSPPWVDGLTIGSVLRETASRYADQDAIVFSSESWSATWAELDAEVDRVAKALLSLGFRQGDHFGVWSTNIPAWVLLQFATARIGVVLVTINPSYRTSELAFVMRQSELKGIALIDHYKTTNYHASLQEAIPELVTSQPGNLVSDDFPHLKVILSLRGSPLPGSFSWDAFLKRADGVSNAELRLAEAGTNSSDPINIQFTSGTTGKPKGATLSHRNILLNAYYAGHGQALTNQDRLCIPVPLYHCFGCVLGTLVSVIHGTTMVFPSETFHAGATLQALETERCTGVYGVPTMFIAMLEHADYPSRKLKSLRTGIMAGSPCPIELMKRVTSEMGASQMTIGYGQTEAAPLITQTRVDDSLDLRVGTVGRALPGVEVKIVDPATGEALPVMSSGELCCRGHNVMLGYFRLPEKTAAAIDQDGWLHTGDLALQEPNGYFRITGRIKDLVIRGGENVFPREIEEVLYQHPAIKDVQVIGVPDRKFGEEVMAWVCLRDGCNATHEELKAFCKERLAYFKVPHYWKFVEAFPTTVTGKIQKFRMREISIAELGLQKVAEIETA
jgi:fatty-acyl-CoA synthase